MHYESYQGGEEMTNIKSFIKNNIRQYAMAVALVVILVLFQILTGGIVFKPLNVTNIILQNSYVLILGVGMLLVILTGNVDLSVGSVCAFIGALSAVFIVKWGIPVIPAVVLCLLIGIAAGMWNGFWIAYVRMPAFIVTLAGFLAFRGLTMVLLKGETVGPFPQSFQAMANGFLPETLKFGGFNAIAVLTGLILSLVYIFMEYKSIKNKKKYNFELLPMGLTIAKMAVIIVAINLLTFSLSAYKGIPIVLIIIVGLIAVYTFITQKTIAGRHIYALGGNEKAAKLSGIKTKRVMFWVYANMGLLGWWWRAV
jgi:putative multiple sugar transport system permease protein